MVSHGFEVSLWMAVLLFCGGLGFFLFSRQVGGAALIFLLGIVLYSSRYEILSENDLRLIIEEKPALVSLRGYLLETPSAREFPGRSNNVEYSYARLAVREVLFEREWRPALGTVATTTRGLLNPEIFKGRSVEVGGVLAPPRRAAAPGLFDFRQYLYNARIFYQLRCDSTNDWTLTSFEALPLTERFQRWAAGQLARGLPGDDEPLNMVRAMALGTNQSLNGEIADVFMKTGTLHIFAISGLHIACIAGCLLLLLRLFGVPRDRAALILIPLVWFYTLATGWQSSAVRSALMSTFVFAGWALARPTELLNSTAGAGLLILLFAPEQLFQASFQLSFTVVLAIALVLARSPHNNSLHVRIQDRLLGYDPLLPPELRPKWKGILEIPLTFLLGNLAISSASWIGSNPLTAYYFNLVTPMSLLANLIAVPLSSISLAATLGSLLFPPLGPICNYLSWATMWETIAVTRWLAHFPWGSFYVPKPNGWFFLAYGVMAFFLFVPGVRNRWPKRYALALSGAALIVWLCSLVPRAGSTVITLLPSRGNPLVVDAPGRAQDLLIDCSNSRGAEQLLRRFLHAQGFGSVPNLLLTQGSINHVGGFATLFKEFSPQTIFASSVRGRSRAYRDVIAEAERVQVLKKIGAGGKLLDWNVLHPAEERGFPRSDDNAVVLRATVNGWKILLLSELGSQGRRALLERATDLQADILFCGTAEQSEDLPFIERIAPKLIVLGTGESAYPRARPRKRPKAPGAWIVANSSESAVTITLTRTACAVATAGQNFLLEQSPILRR